ncbi:hypothetical protein ACFVTT_02510 [Streptomyces niveus]|uniref:hypothetical protein n=1 Tax=Streptomyces niveus TaxID=193462 RepID=UPI00343EF455
MLVSLGVLAAVGLAVGLLVPDQKKPTVAVPDQVCQELLPSTHVKPLLPENGEAFEEEKSVNFGVGASKGRGSCDLSAGGSALAISFSRIQDPEYTMDTVARQAEEPGRTPISLGPAAGYLGDYNTWLYAPCPHAKGRGDLLAVKVGVSGVPEIKDRATMEKVAALTADVTRAVAREVEDCEGAGELPDTAPEIG